MQPASVSSSNFVLGGLPVVMRCHGILQSIAAGLEAETCCAGIVDCFVRVAKCQGILSFWRGNLANVRPSRSTHISWSF